MPRASRPGFLAFVFACLVLAFALAGCGSDDVTQPNVGPYGSIVISSPADTTIIQSSLPFTAVVTDTSGNPVSSPVITWQSSDPAVASINSSGQLTPKVEGTTTIHATGGGVISNPIDVVVIQDFGWVDQSSALKSLADLNGVHFVNRLRGWVVGATGNIFATNDAGLTWHRQNSNNLNTLNSVFFPTSSHGFVVGGAGTILETTDAGLTWRVRTGIDTDNGAGLNDVTFYDNKHGFIVGNGGIILRTDDAGATWTRLLPSVASEDLYSVSATTLLGPDTTAWAVGALGRIVGTEDAGATWRTTPSPFTVGTFTSVVRRTRDSAFAVGSGNITATTVSGAPGPDWVQAPVPPNATEFYGLAWPTTVQLVAVGENSGGSATILRSVDQGSTWITQDLPSGAVLSGHGLRDVWFVDHDRGWAVGRQGAILHTATGGNP